MSWALPGTPKQKSNVIKDLYIMQVIDPYRQFIFSSPMYINSHLGYNGSILLRRENNAKSNS